MSRVSGILLIALIYFILNGSEARTWTSRPKKTTTTMVPWVEEVTESKPVVSEIPVVVAGESSVQSEDELDTAVEEEERPHLVEKSDHRFLDGHYEFRYLLSNGDTRYERSYWVGTGDDKILARKGYYSYPLPDKKYLTVFYTADSTGFHEQSASYSDTQPPLPQTIDVPEQVESAVVTSKPVNKPTVAVATTRKPVVTVATPSKRPVTPNRKPTRRPVTQKKISEESEIENADLVDDNTEVVTEPEE